MRNILCGVTQTLLSWPVLANDQIVTQDGWFKEVPDWLSWNGNGHTTASAIDGWWCKGGQATWLQTGHWSWQEGSSGIILILKQPCHLCWASLHHCEEWERTSLPKIDGTFGGRRSTLRTTRPKQQANHPLIGHIRPFFEDRNHNYYLPESPKRKIRVYMRVWPPIAILRR